MKNLFFAGGLMLSCCLAAQPPVEIIIAERPEESCVTTNNKDFPTLNEFFVKTWDSVKLKFNRTYNDEVTVLIGDSGCQLNLPGSGQAEFNFIVRGLSTGIASMIEAEDDVLRITATATCDSFLTAELRKMALNIGNDTFEFKPCKDGTKNQSGTNTVVRDTFLNDSIISLLREIDAQSGAIQPDNSWRTNETHTMEYNIWNGSLRLYKSGSDLKTPDILKFPKVNSVIDFHAYNYNPYRDTVSMQISFEDYFKNAEAEFENLLNPSAGMAGSEEEAAFVPADESLVEDEDIEQITKLRIKEFSEGITSLQAILYSKRSIDEENLVQILQYVDLQIAYFFGIRYVTANKIQSKGEFLINENINQNERPAYKILLNKGIAAYEKLQRYNFIGFHSVQVEEKDLTNILIYTGKDGKLSDQPMTRKLRNKGGWGFGYSIGFMYSGLRDYSYDIKRVSQINERTTTTEDGNMDSIAIDTVYRDSIFRVDEGNFNIGILALGHVYTRLPGLGNLAFSLGLGLNTQLDDHYFLGGSLMLGRKRQLVLSGGLVFAKVNRLEAGRSEGELLPVKEEEVNQANASRKVWDNGIFGAVSFQF